MPRLLSLLLLLMWSLIPIYAQKKGYEPGYIITQDGDTIMGQVKDRSAEPFVELFSRIRFIPEGRRSRKKYGPWEIQGYGAGSRDYVSVPLREETAFFKFRYYLDGAEKVFLRVLRRDGPLAFYHREFVYDDNNFQDFYPLIHREGDWEMVRVTQGLLGLKRQRLAEYFRDCRLLVDAINSKELKEAEEVYDFYLDNCLENRKQAPN